MAVYAFYIFDRHTECIYTKQWVPPQDRPLSGSSQTAVAAPPPDGTAGLDRSSLGGAATASAAVVSNDDRNRARLIFGTVFSLRNMVRKLGGDNDAFVAYRTAEYKLHYYETPSNLRLVLLTDTAAPGMRNVLHQIYINLWVEYVVKNPLSPVEHKGGEGVKNELFELGLDQFVRGLM